MPNHPNWTRDELILALDLYFRVNPIKSRPWASIESLKAIIAQARAILTLLALFLVTAVSAQDPITTTAITIFGDVTALKQKAEAGDARAQIALGDIESSNLHANKARQWYRKAAEQGNIEGAYKLGSCLFQNSYDSSFGLVKADPNEAIRWTLRAANNYHPGACHEIARAINRGQGVTTNLIEAYAWTQLALDLRIDPMMTKYELNQMALKLDSPGIQKAKALAAEFKSGNWRHSVTQTIPEGDPRLKLNGIIHSGGTAMATINGKSLAVGDTVQFTFPPVTVTVKCLAIEKNSVLITFDTDPTPRRLSFK